METSIVYDRSTRDFACYVDGVLIGFFSSYHSAEVAADAYRRDALASWSTVAAKLVAETVAELTHQQVTA